LAPVQKEHNVATHVVIIETPLTLASSTSTFGTSSTPTFGYLGFGQTSFHRQLIGSKRGHEKNNFKGKVGMHNPHEKTNIHCDRCRKNGSHEENTCRIPWDKIKDKKDKKEDKGKASDMVKGKALESAHSIVAHCNIGVTEDLFNTSFSSWRDVWLLETGATCHMTF